MGGPDRRVAPPCERRPITTVEAGVGVEGLLSVLGCTFSYEYIRKGVRYRTRSGYVIEVYIVTKLLNRHEPSASEAVGAGQESHGIVEVSCENGASPEELTAFMQYLQPFVSLRPLGKPRRA